MAEQQPKSGDYLKVHIYPESILSYVECNGQKLRNVSRIKTDSNAKAHTLVEFTCFVPKSSEIVVEGYLITKELAEQLGLAPGGE